MSGVAASPDVKGSVEQIISGELFSGLLLDDTDQRALALETLLGEVVDPDTRLVWVGNPLRAPLTIDRFLIQVVGPEIDLREEYDSEAVARMVATRVGHETRLLIVVQQPETIDTETRDMLVEMGGYLGGEAVQVQFLFAGSSAFVVPQLAKPDIPAFSSRFPIAEPPDIRVASLSPRRREVLPLLLLLLTATVGVVFSMAPALQDSMPLALPPSPDALQLRREFEAFLAQRTPMLPAMTESEKVAVLREFLTHQHHD